MIYDLTAKLRNIRFVCVCVCVHDGGSLHLPGMGYTKNSTPRNTLIGFRTIHTIHNDDDNNNNRMASAMRMTSGKL